MTRLLLLALIVGLLSASPTSGKELPRASQTKKSSVNVSQQTKTHSNGSPQNGQSAAQDLKNVVERLQKEVGGKSQGGGTYGLFAILALTVFSLAPAILVMVTSFTRIIIVLYFLRQAIGLQNVPPNQVIMGLALFLTYFSMGGVIGEIHEEAVRPYVDGSVTATQALKKGETPIRHYMLRFTRESDLELLLEMYSGDRPSGPSDIPFTVLVPAFVLGELRAAFIIGLVLFLPFLIIDLVVAVVLTSAGLTMLTPNSVSLPFKLLLFVLVDGWSLVVGSLVRSVVF